MELIENFVVGIVYGLLVSIAITPLFCFVRKIWYVPLVQKKYVKKAIEDGRVVQAKLMKSWDSWNQSESGAIIASNEVLGVYTYEYKGKKYKYRASSTSHLADELTLYFLKNPRKASLENEIGFRESNWIQYYFVIAAIGCVKYMLFGVTYAAI